MICSYFFCFAFTSLPTLIKLNDHFTVHHSSHTNFQCFITKVSISSPKSGFLYKTHQNSYKTTKNNYRDFRSTKFQHQNLRCFIQKPSILILHELFIVSSKDRTGSRFKFMLIFIIFDKSLEST